MLAAAATHTPLRQPLAPSMLGLRPTAPATPAFRPQAVPQNRLHFADGQEIFCEGDDATHIYEIVSGAVRTSKVLSDGRRQIDAFHFAGDMFGMELGDEHRFSADALGEVVLIARRRSALDTRPGEDTATARAILASTLRMLERAQEHLVLLGRKTALEKVGSFLVQVMDRAGEAERIDLPMSRLDIADHLGLTIETVSRTLMDLQRKQIIAFEPCSRAIIVRNRSALRRMAE
jgi:CRP/FNR family transcriptional regulator, nitrogen fixation regulation protein